jgi:transcriptional regulator
MHPNPVYRQMPNDQNLAFVRERGFGVLTVNGPEAPLAAHIPVTLADGGQSLELHLVRSNPIARLAGPIPALMIVSGPDGYVSPDWYGVEDQVPTWNYVAVHLRGVLEPLPNAELRAVLDGISDEFETRLAPKQPWRAEKMPGDLLDRMMRQIVPFRLRIEDVQGTWKLNQNKTDAVRLAAAAEIDKATGAGQEHARLAALMQRPDLPKS